MNRSITTTRLLRHSFIVLTTALAMAGCNIDEYNKNPEWHESGVLGITELMLDGAPNVADTRAETEDSNTKPVANGVFEGIAPNTAIVNLTDGNELAVQYNFLGNEAYTGTTSGTGFNKHTATAIFNGRTWTLTPVSGSSLRPNDGGDKGETWAGARMQMSVIGTPATGTGTLKDRWMNYATTPDKTLPGGITAEERIYYDALIATTGNLSTTGSGIIEGEATDAGVVKSKIHIDRILDSETLGKVRVSLAHPGALLRLRDDKITVGTSKDDTRLSNIWAHIKSTNATTGAEEDFYVLFSKVTVNTGGTSIACRQAIIPGGATLLGFLMDIDSGTAVGYDLPENGKVLDATKRYDTELNISEPTPSTPGASIQATLTFITQNGVPGWNEPEEEMIDWTKHLALTASSSTTGDAVYSYRVLTDRGLTALNSWITSPDNTPAPLSEGGVAVSTGNRLATNITLTKSLTLTGTNNWTPMGTETTPYTGIFSGKDPDAATPEGKEIAYTINNLHIKGSLTGTNLGLIGVLSKNASSKGGEVKDLLVSGSTIEGTGNLGAIVGTNLSGTVTNCITSGTTVINGTGSNVGGLVGENRGAILGSTNQAQVTGKGDTGGIAGSNAVSGLISGSRNIHDTSIGSGLGTTSGDVKGSGNNTGGVVGSNKGIVITCGSTGTITSSGSNTGGVVGVNANNAYTVGSYNTGAVNGIASTTGSIAGTSVGSVSNCFPIADATSTNVSNGNFVESTAHADLNNYIPYMNAAIKAHNKNMAGNNDQSPKYGAYGWLAGIDTNKNIPTVTSIKKALIGLWYDPAYNTYRASSAAGLMMVNSWLNNNNDKEDGPIADNDKQWTSAASGTVKYTVNISLGSNITLPKLNGGNWHPIELQGIFNGNSNTLKGVQIINNQNFIGLISHLKKSGTVQDIILDGIDFSLVQQNQDPNIGGVVGWNDEGIVKNCHVMNTAKIKGAYCTAGIVATNDGIVTGCSNAAEVVGATVPSGANKDCTGGIVAINKGVVVGCSNTGKISGANSVGGIAGTTDFSKNIIKQIIGSWNTGQVTGSKSVGSIVGNHSNLVKIFKCFPMTDNAGKGNFAGLTNYTDLNTYVYVMNNASKRYNQTPEAIVNSSKQCPHFWKEESGGVPTTQKDVTVGLTYSNNTYTATTAEGLMLVSQWLAEEVYYEYTASGMAVSDQSGPVGDGNNGQWTGSAKFTVNISLGADITLPDQCIELPIGTGNWSPIGMNIYAYAWGYQGTFEGGNHTLSNLKASGENLGLIGRIANGTIQNITLDKATFKGKDGVGGIVGISLLGSHNTIRNCHVKSNCSISGKTYVGGIIGSHFDSSSDRATLIGCTNEADVTGYQNVGGIGGYAVCNVVACSNTGRITGNDHVGGILGIGGTATLFIIGCWNTGVVEGNTSISDSYIGSVLGRRWFAWDYDMLSGCYPSTNNGEKQYNYPGETTFTNVNNYIGTMNSRLNTRVTDGWKWELKKIDGVERPFPVKK